MNKVVASAAEAVADVFDGASISISGFGLSSGVPNSLLAAAVEQGAKNLCLVANGVGGAAAKLIENGQVSRLIVSFVSRPNIDSAAGTRAAAGEIDFEVVPQGTLVERLRAGGAGLAGVYTPTGVGTPIAERAAALLPDHSYVNLGLGIPTLVSNYIRGRDITLHGENGILGYGAPVAEGAIDYYVHDAGGGYVSPRAGMAFFDSVTAFE